MRDELKKKEEESNLDYICRLYNNKVEYNLSNREIYDIYTSETGDIRGESTVRCEAMNYIKGFNNGFEKALSNRESDNLEEQREILRNIKIERNKLSVERMENNKILRDYSRVDMKFDQIENAIKSLKPLDIPIYFPYLKNKKEGILVLTDTHYGKRTLIKGLKGEVINEYNEDIFKERMEKLLVETVEISNKEDIERIHLTLQGDLIEGMLRNSTLMNLQNGMIDQTMQFAEYIATWLNKLSEYVLIDLYYCLGNHSEARILNAKSGDFPQENLERVIIFYLKSRLKENKNITIHSNDTGFIFFDCLGTTIMGSHGQEKNLEQALKDYSHIYKENIDMFITGHLHHNSSKEIGLDTEIIRAGSICGVDDYSMKLRKTSNASTVFMVIEEGKGKTITYNIKLK